MANTEIKYCSNCSANKIEHEFQDNTYGKYRRVFNINEKTGVGNCTVCSSGKKIKK